MEEKSRLEMERMLHEYTNRPNVAALEEEIRLQEEENAKLENEAAAKTEADKQAAIKEELARYQAPLVKGLADESLTRQERIAALRSEVR